MSQKGRKIARPTEGVPWPEALQIAGGRESLIAGRPYSTRKAWEGTPERPGEVPGYVLVPFLLRWWRVEIAPLLPTPVAQELDDALEMVRKYYGTPRWERLLLALRLVGPEFTHEHDPRRGR